MLAGSVAVLGRVERLPRQRLARELERAGAELVRRFSRRCSFLAIAHGAVTALRDGSLEPTLGEAEHAGAVVVSENQLLRRLYLLPEPPNENRELSGEDSAARCGLTIAQLRLLSLFDVLEPVAGQFGFRDLILARNLAALLSSGVDLSATIAAALAAKRSLSPGDHLSQLRFRIEPDGSLALAGEDGTTELDGQRRLPLDFEAGSFEAEFERAEVAEETGDLDGAERAYRRCLRLRRGHAITLFNLSNVLCDKGERGEARLLLQQAIGVNPGFAEAWYNLAHLSSPAEARACLQRALQAEPGYADAIFNLARLETDAGRDREAIELWDRYLSLDDASDWADRARRALAVCRMRRAGHAVVDQPGC